jgi:hypothetical protein
MYLFILIILIILILITIYKLFKKKDVVEGYYDIIPYNYHWNIFKCLTTPCIEKKSFECFRWCDNWEEEGAKNNCRMRCADYADIQTESLKYNDYTFKDILPVFNTYSLLNNDADWDKFKWYYY